MKTLKILLLALLPVVVFAQNSNIDRHAISAKVLGIDYGMDPTFGLELSYRYLLTKHIGLVLPMKMGVADVEDNTQNVNITSFDGLVHLYPLAGKGRLTPYVLGGVGYVFENLDGGNMQIPLGAGINYMIGKNSYASLQVEHRLSQEELRDNTQVGIGYVYQFGSVDTDGDGLVDSEDNCPEELGPAATGGCPDTDNDGVANSIDACPEEAGSTYTNGCPDSDEDGIADTEDKCPEEAGVAAFNGCPDTDEDGIADSEDACPENKGPKETNGCPDTDKDGVVDSEDKCPDMAGTAEMSGCPDSDGDGVHDKADECPDEFGIVSKAGCPGNDRDGDGVADDNDRCPDVAGTIETIGCPDDDGDGVRNSDDRCPQKAGPYAGCPDSDGDGVVDADDRCPDEAGPTTNRGCPELEEEVRDVLELAMRAVQFELGSAELKMESYDILNQITMIMERYPAYQLRIAGHTDNVGDPKRNQELSEARAAACYEYLLSKGARASRMTYAGFGEDYPIAPNSSSSGRFLNRRVEFDLIIR